MDRKKCAQCNTRLAEKKRLKCGICRRSPEQNRERWSRDNKIKRAKRFGGYVKLSECERCGFVPEHSCQLDVDHMDGNHANDDPSNLMTLCANCHRLKTFTNKDYVKVLTGLQT